MATDLASYVKKHDSSIKTDPFAGIASLHDANTSGFSNISIETDVDMRGLVGQAQHVATQTIERNTIELQHSSVAS